jgi:hypothetical protein
MRVHRNEEGDIMQIEQTAPGFKLTILTIGHDVAVFHFNTLDELGWGAPMGDGTPNMLDPKLTGGIDHCEHERDDERRRDNAT